MSFTLYSRGPARSRVSKSSGRSATSLSMAASTSARNDAPVRLQAVFTVPLPSGQAAEMVGGVLVAVGMGVGVPVATGVGVEGASVTGGLLVGEPPPHPDKKSAAAAIERPSVFPTTTSCGRPYERTHRKARPSS